MRRGYPRTLLEHQLVTGKVAAAMDVLRDFTADVYGYHVALSTPEGPEVRLECLATDTLPIREFFM
jgi:hypothetical protein